MSTGARFRTIPDVLRMGRAMRQPGIDPRTWSTSGRIDPEGDSIRWDSELGWVVDVIGFGGGFEQETLTAKVAMNNPFEYVPLLKDCEVHVSVPEGEATGNPAILGTLHNDDGCEAPGVVTGMDVDGVSETTPLDSAFDSKSGTISPYDNELKFTPHNRREEYGGDHVDVAANQVLEAVDQVRLATRLATQSYVRGENFLAYLDPYLNSIVAYIEASSAANLKVYAAINGLASGSVSPDEIAAVKAAVSAITETVGNGGTKATYDVAVDEPGVVLSERIKGE